MTFVQIETRQRTNQSDDMNYEARVLSRERVIH